MTPKIKIKQKRVSRGKSIIRKNVSEESKTMKISESKLNFLANVLIISVALMIVSFLAVKFISPSLPEMPEVKAGDKISLAGTDFSKPKKTLLVALQADCHYCSESADFYRRLAKSVEGRKDLQIIVVFPHSPETGAAYLEKLQIPFGELRQGSFEDLKVFGTPTLMLVNNNGIVSNVWFGKLRATAENEVLANFAEQF
jgi:hypothetical protein